MVTTSKPNGPSAQAINRRSIWKTGLLILVIVLGVFALLLVIRSVASPTPIVISADTTFVKEPLTADGQNIDYVQLLPKRLTQSNPRDDPWTAMMFRSDTMSSTTALADTPNIVYDNPVRLNPATSDETGDRKQAFDERQKARSNQPFTANLDPEYAALVDANEPWYQAVIKQEPGPVSVQPRDFPGIGRISLEYLELPLMDTHQEITSAFQLRAMLAIGRREFDKVLQSAQIISKCADREAQIPFIMTETLSLNLRERATHVIMVTMMSFDTLRNSQIELLLSSIEPRQQDRDTELLHFRRLTLLDGIQSGREIGFHIWLAPPKNGIRPSDVTMVKEGALAAFQRGGFGEYKRWTQFNRIRVAIDCNVLMRAVNQMHGQLKEALSSSTYQEQSKRIQQIRNPVKSSFGHFNQPLSEYTSDELTTMAKSFVALQMRTMPELAAADTNLHRFLHIVPRIHRFKQATEAYPESLDELAPEQFGATMKPDAFTDAFSSEPLRYRKTQSGFVLSSVGRNLVDDSKKVITSDDIPELIDDFVFAWPLK